MNIEKINNYPLGLPTNYSIVNILDYLPYPLINQGTYGNIIKIYEKIVVKKIKRKINIEKFSLKVNNEINTLKAIHLISTINNFYLNTVEIYEVQRMKNIVNFSMSDISSDKEVKKLAFSYSDNSDENSWGITPMCKILSLNLISNDILIKHIPYELGFIWAQLICKYYIVLWEPELYLTKIDGKVKIFILDFDKVYNVSPTNLLVTINTGIHDNIISIYDTLSFIFPQKHSKYYEYFKKGIYDGDLTNNKIIFKNLNH